MYEVKWVSETEFLGYWSIFIDGVQVIGHAYHNMADANVALIMLGPTS